MHASSIGSESVEMNAIETILTRIGANGSKPSLFWKEREFSYADLNRMIDEWTARLLTYKIDAGCVCGVVSDYSPQTTALFFALMKANAILVPLTRAIESEMPELIKIAGVQHLLRFADDDSWTHEPLNNFEQNELVNTFRQRKSPGLIVFTSGSTGKPKGILHDCERVMRKFVPERPGWRTVLFLMMDHFGGFNTLLSSFAYGGMGVCVADRSAETVARSIELSRATLLPTTPTFLNLLIASGCYNGRDLSSVELISYGTEVMPDSTLQKIKVIFPKAHMKQTYGLSELGVLRSKSESDESVWVKIGGDGFNVKVVENILWVKSEANMVGYLNAPNPFDEDGWLCTGDHVEVRGDYMRILGRKTEMINVGGQKVLPIEVENVLLQADGIREATVYGSKHPLMGQVVMARVSLYSQEDPQVLSERLRAHCLSRLAKYKIPVRFVIVDESEQHNERFKKLRQFK